MSCAFRRTPLLVSLCATLSLAISAAVVGCRTPKGYAAREWSLAMREMQIVPVFPPREDVLVGDVYAVRELELKAEASATKDQANSPPSTTRRSSRSGYVPI